MHVWLRKPIPPDAGLWCSALESAPMNTSSQSTKPPPPGGPRLFRKSLLIKAGVAVAGLGAAGAL
ncbi:hypothetical protein CKW47_10320, partial [Bordetella pertussis]